jgi:hypothetical protein
LMAHTITLRAQGATRSSDTRLSCPVSSRASMYLISPCFPSAIHAGKTRNSAKSRTGAMPQRSNPASRAYCLMRVGRPGNTWAVARGQFSRWAELTSSKRLPLRGCEGNGLVSSNNGRVELQPPKRSESLRSSLWRVALNQNRERFQCIGVSGSPYERHVVVIRPFHPKSFFFSCASSASITWERIASRRRPAFSSHLITTTIGKQ